MFLGEAAGTDGPYTKGTYLWIEVGDWPRWEEKFIYGPYIHHVVGVHGHVAPILYEACKYVPGLKPDPVEPGPPAGGLCAPTGVHRRLREEQHR